MFFSHLLALLISVAAFHSHSLADNTITEAIDTKDAQSQQLNSGVFSASLSFYKKSDIRATVPKNFVLTSEWSSDRVDLDKKSDVGSSGSTSVVDQDGSDISYMVEVKIGENNQSFSLIVDTGSYYTWVYGSDCESSSCTSHSRFAPNSSSTAVETNGNFSISYTSSSVSGDVITDDMQFAGFDTRLSFGIANTAGSAFSSFPIDGIMGLPASDNSGSSFPSIMNVLKDQSLISDRVFAVNLGRAKDLSDQGSITFGGVDTSKYSGDISYTSVKSGSVLWDIPIQDVFVDGNRVDFAATRNTIIDTGTTLMILPPDDALKLHGYIQGSQTDGQNFALPCNTTANLQIEFDNVRWSVSPLDYVGDKYQNEDNLCVSNIQGIQFADNKWILGDVFLKNVYSVFDMDQQRIGFANKTIDPTVASPSDVLVNTLSDASSSVSSDLSSSSYSPVIPSTSSSSSISQSTSISISTSESDISSSDTSSSSQSSNTTSIAQSTSDNLLSKDSSSLTTSPVSTTSSDLSATVISTTPTASSSPSKPADTVSASGQTSFATSIPSSNSAFASIYCDSHWRLILLSLAFSMFFI